MPELCDVYDRNGNKTGRIQPRGLPLKNGDYRLVVYAWIEDEAGRVLLTRRHAAKKLWGGYWECTGGGVQAGETSLDAALRELHEEIGVSFRPSEATLLRRELDGDTFLDIWLFRKHPALSELRLQPDEVAEAKWADRSEYELLCRAGRMVPFCTRFYQWREEKENEIERNRKTLRSESGGKDVPRPRPGMHAEGRRL